jgi:hypothetical protein
MPCHPANGVRPVPPTLLLTDDHLTRDKRAVAAAMRATGARASRRDDALGVSMHAGSAARSGHCAHRTVAGPGSTVRRTGRNRGPRT